MLTINQHLWRELDPEPLNLKSDVLPIQAQSALC